MPGSSFDTIVVGRGIIGASIAWRLAQAGMSVAVIEAHTRGQATKAAAGMLAPLAESNSLPELAKLGIPSLQMYPEFLEELSQEAGTTVSMNGPGILRVALDEGEEEELQGSFGRQSASPFPVVFLTGDEARALEPSLTPDVRAAVLSTAEKHVVPLVVLDAMGMAYARKNVVDISDTVVALRRVNASWSVEATAGSYECKQLVVAGGVWTRALLNHVRYDPPITPLKGQLLQMKYRRIEPPTHTIYAHSTYIVPRSASEVMLGTTEEPDADFDASLTTEAVTSLRERGARLLLSMAEASLQRGFAGLRPASPDRLPILGPVPGQENIFIAGGHGRNGILLAPITAKFMRDLIVDGVTPPASVDPARFSQPQ